MYHYFTQINLFYHFNMYRNLQCFFINHFIRIYSYIVIIINLMYLNSYLYVFTSFNIESFSYNSVNFNSI